MTKILASARWRIGRTIEPTLDAADRICADVRSRLRECASPADWYGVELLLREALTNAVLHGGAGAGRRVRCEVRVGARAARVAVDDGGPGFDWRRVLERPTTEGATSGRGLKIYDMYADRVSFNRAGNRVVLVRRLSGSRARGRSARGRSAAAVEAAAGTERELT